MRYRGGAGAAPSPLLPPKYLPAYRAFLCHVKDMPTALLVQAAAAFGITLDPAAVEAERAAMARPRRGAAPVALAADTAPPADAIIEALVGWLGARPDAFDRPWTAASLAAALHEYQQASGRDPRVVPTPAWLVRRISLASDALAARHGIATHRRHTRNGNSIRFQHCPGAR